MGFNIQNTGLGGKIKFSGLMTGGFRARYIFQDTSPLLDTYPGANTALSLRKLSTAYTGSAIRVRRSSDNTEQNIGFNADGSLNTTALLSFVGSANGFVTTWYDQSGNLQNGVQSTAGNQPSIVVAGVLQTKNGKPCVQFTGANITYLSIRAFAFPSTNFSVYFAGSVNNITTNNCFGTDGTGLNANGIYLETNKIVFNSGGGNSISNSTALTNDTLSLLSHHYLANNTAQSATNGVATAFNSMLIGGAPFTGGRYSVNINTFYLGAYQNTARQFVAAQSLTGNISEFISYRSSDQSSNRTGIESNINSYYTIY